MGTVSTAVVFKVILPIFIDMPVFPEEADIVLSGCSVTDDGSCRFVSKPLLSHFIYHSSTGE